MKQNYKSNSNCVATNVTCVTWNLPGITCLGIKTGDTLDEVTFAIVTKLCENTGLDLEDIDLECLIEKLDITEPTTKTIRTYLQLAYDNDCKLYDLIQQLREEINPATPPLQLDLKCLKQTDPFGAPIPYTTQTVLQDLINQGCGFVAQIAGLSSAITAVNIRINDLPAPYVEPTLTTCLSSTPKSSSATLTLLASDYCAYKKKIGSIAQIDAAIGNQSDVLADPLFPISDLLPLVGSLSESDYNQWVFISNNYKRLLDLEACACRAKCSDIKIGFNPIDQEDGESIVIDFSGDYGNYIPTDYALQTDSTIVFIDKTKKQKTYPLPTTPGVFKTEYTTAPYDISMLDLDGMMTIKVCVKLKNLKTGEVCCKCEEAQHMFIGGCSYCELTTTEAVTIIYKNC